MTGVASSGSAPRQAQLVAAARALAKSADHGSLALWGGQVAHGLRFTSRRLGGTPSLSAPSTLTAAAEELDDRPDAPLVAGQTPSEPTGAHLSTRDAPAHDGPAAEQATAGGPAADEPATSIEEMAGMDAVWPAGAVDRLLLLAPITIGRLLGDDDQACRFQLCGPAPEQGRWVSVAFGGWVAAVPAPEAAQLALHFADRHPTADLFDLGEQWAMVEIDVVEAFVRTRDGGMYLDTDAARSLLAS